MICWPDLNLLRKIGTKRRMDASKMTRCDLKPHLNTAQIRSHSVFAVYTHATSVFMCMRHTVPDVCEKILLVDSVIASYLDSTEHFRHKVLAKIKDSIACMLHWQCNPRMHCNKLKVSDARREKEVLIVAQIVEHGINNAMVMGLIPRECMNWIKVSAKCKNVTCNAHWRSISSDL